MQKIEIPYAERDGILYPALSVPVDAKLSEVGKYGLLWLRYMRENHVERFRTLTRLGCVNQKAVQINADAYEMIETIITRYMQKHPPQNSNSTIEMWRLREEAKCIAEEMILKDFIYQYR